MTFKKTASYLVIGVAAMAVATLALPRHVSVERSAVMDASPAEVIELAASNTGYQSFNPYKNLDPNLQVKMFGPTSGVGSGFFFESKDGVGHQTVAAVTPEKVTFAIDLGSFGQPIQSISAKAVEDTTLVTWTLQMDLGLNPVFRVMGLFMDGMIGPNFELGLANIADVTA